MENNVTKMPSSVTANDDDFDAVMQESTELVPVSRDRAQRFYDRIRARIKTYLENKGPVVEKSASLLLLVPDIFILLWRLVNDGRVTGKNKVLLGSGIAYYLFPLDMIPEALLGPMGYVDDLVLGVFILNRILADTDEAILREHWSGSEDLFGAIRKVLDTADNLIGSDMVNRIKRIVK